MSTKHTALRPAKRAGPVNHLITPSLGIFTVAEANVCIADTDATCPRASPSTRISS
jgi:hypothetical protein